MDQMNFFLFFLIINELFWRLIDQIFCLSEIIISEISWKYEYYK